MIITLDTNTESEFPVQITVEGAHNHSLTSASCLRGLRTSRETIAEYCCYFEQGTYSS